MRRIATLLAAAIGAVAWTASAAGGVHVSLAGAAPTPTVGKAWTAKLTVRPVSFRGAVGVTASGPGRVDVRASGGHGSYRARLVFPAAGRWTLTARAGSSTARLGSVTVRKAAATPLTFVWPTSVDVEPGGSLLVVENGLRRLVRLDPVTGRVTQIAALTKPYAVRRAASGAVFVSDGPVLRRIDGTRPPAKVAEADGDIGPIAIAPNGDVYFTTETTLWKLAGGQGTPVRQAAGTPFSSPHGLAIAGDGAVLVADTGNHVVRRVDPATGAVTAFAQLENPRGMDGCRRRDGLRRRRKGEARPPPGRGRCPPRVREPGVRRPVRPCARLRRRDLRGRHGAVRPPSPRRRGREGDHGLEPLEREARPGGRGSARQGTSRRRPHRR